MKIQFTYPLDDIINHTKKGPDGIMIMWGKTCTDCWCPHRSECKMYKKNRFAFHNVTCKITTFFKYKLGWKKFHIPFYWKYELETEMSGSELCPMRLERRYECWDCEYMRGDEDCTCKDYGEDIKNGMYPEFGSGKCRHFKLSAYGDRWDRKTGERIF